MEHACIIYMFPNLSNFKYIYTLECCFIATNVLLVVFMGHVYFGKITFFIVTCIKNGVAVNNTHVHIPCICIIDHIYLYWCNIV